MRLTYSDLLTGWKRGTQNTGTEDANLIADFQRFLTIRYQTIFGALQGYQDISPRTASTVDGQQFYHNPPGMGKIETATVDIGTLTPPLITIHSQFEWDRLNSITLEGSIPLAIFPRKDDFGIYPIPNGVYTITMNAHMRDMMRFNADYVTGTISITSGARTVTGSGTTFTSSMVGRWLKVDNDKYWYRISGFTSTTEITLETAFYSSSVSGSTYRIGESPELPEEAHNLLITGPIADYNGEIRGDMDKFAHFDNLFWTGNVKDTTRDGDGAGGLEGLVSRYLSRDNSNLVHRNSEGDDFYTNKLWSTEASS